MTTDRKPGTTKEEEKMYAVMEAIFDSGIPISFKGSMVMKAFLVQAGYQGGRPPYEGHRWKLEHRLSADIQTGCVFGSAGA